MNTQAAPAIFGETFKLFSKRDKSALCIQYTQTERDNYPTITIELAPFNGKADWNQKKSLQLTRMELTAFCKTALGIIASCEGSYHGGARNKGFSLFFHSDKGMVLNVTEKGRLSTIGISVDERTEIRAFVVARLATAWKMSVVDVMSLIRYP